MSEATAVKTHVRFRGHMSIDAAARAAGGYPQLWRALAKEHGIDLVQVGRARYIRDEDIPRLKKLVVKWLNRPRISHIYRRAIRTRSA
jgi:hypothetical protein